MSFRVLTFLVALVLAAAVPRAVAAETLRIASPQRGSWEGAIPELGKEAGIFQKHGLDLDILYTQGGGETLQVVVSGAVDIGLSAGTLGTLGAYAKGAPVRIIAASSTGSREVFWFVPAGSALKSMRDINGQSIAYSTAGVTRQRAEVHQAVRAQCAAGSYWGRCRNHHPDHVGSGGRRLVGGAVHAGRARKRRSSHDRTRERS
jgi:ABC-type nitrate/sulfonate/bicarbonate transport system substrate-binding protein